MIDLAIPSAASPMLLDPSSHAPTAEPSAPTMVPPMLSAMLFPTATRPRSRSRPLDSMPVPASRAARFALRHAAATASMELT